MQNKKIAIYSGEIPSTTFIERLIEGLAENNTVLLFGHKSKRVNYKLGNIKNFSYKNKIDKFFIVLKYTILLFVFDFKNKQKLDKIIGKKTALKSKYYPVLYHKPDIFHLQWAKGVAEWSWVQEFGIKLFLSLRGTHITISPYSDKKWRTKYFDFFPKLDGFHAVSNAMKKEVLQYGIDPDKIKVIYSGLDLDLLPYRPLTITHHPLTIISIGRNHWVKGYNYALDACKILKENNFNFNYIIIGIDEKSEELIFQRNQLELNEKVEFVSNLPFDKVKENILNANILLLPSIEEGIANVVLEAMALGTIVLTTNCGGMDEVVIDGQNGFVVPIRDSEAIANKIIEISKLSMSEIEIIRQNARKTIENQHNLSIKIKEFEELYK